MNDQTLIEMFKIIIIDQVGRVVISFSSIDRFKGFDGDDLSFLLNLNV